MHMTCRDGDVDRCERISGHVRLELDLRLPLHRCFSRCSRARGTLSARPTVLLQNSQGEEPGRGGVPALSSPSCQTLPAPTDEPPQGRTAPRPDAVRSQVLRGLNKRCSVLVGVDECLKPEFYSFFAAGGVVLVCFGEVQGGYRDPRAPPPQRVSTRRGRAPRAPQTSHGACCTGAHARPGHS